MTHQFEYHAYAAGPPRITWGVQRLVLLTTAIFAAQLLISVPLGRIGEAFGQAPGGIALDWLAFSVNNLFYGLIYTPFTYMFLHGSLSHLFFNMVWLVCFGPEVERYLGTRSFVRFYLFCGAVGVLANLVPWALLRLRIALAAGGGPLQDGAPDILAMASPFVVGASGAVLGVLLVFALIDPEGELQFLFLPFRINRRALIFFVIVLNLLQGIGAMGGGAGVSIATHFGGMAAGYAYFKLRHRIPVIRFGGTRSGSGVSRARKPTRRPGSGASQEPGNDEFDRLGKEVDNIFRFDDKRRGD